MAANERTLILPEHLAVCAPQSGDPPWLDDRFVGYISTTSWSEESPDEPVVHALVLDKTDARLVIDQLTHLLEGS
jgi:hypothetical protein